MSRVNARRKAAPKRAGLGWVGGEPEPCRATRGLRLDEREPGRIVRATGYYLKQTGQIVGDEGQKRWTIRECNCGLCVQLPWYLEQSTGEGDWCIHLPPEGEHVPFPVSRVIVVPGRLAYANRPARPDRHVRICEDCYQSARAPDGGGFVNLGELSDTSSGYEDIAPEHRPRWRHMNTRNLETCDGRGKPKAGDYP